MGVLCRGVRGVCKEHDLVEGILIFVFGIFFVALSDVA